MDAVQERLLRPSATVFVSGFWRSGTTWLQQMLAWSLGGKTIFEPFSVRNETYNRLIEALTKTKRADYKQAFFPYLGDPETFRVLGPYLSAAFRGYCPGAYAVLLRTSALESFRRCIVLKCVRAGFSLSEIERQFDLPIIHVRRHPCAVIASLRETGWNWGFETLSLSELLLTRVDGCRFEGDAETLSHFDRLGVVARVAAYWATSERAVHRALSGSSRTLTVDYEQLAREPLEVVSSVLRSIGCTPLRSPLPELDSAMTSPGRRGLAASVRASDWRVRMSSTEVSIVKEVTTELFPEYQFES